MTSVHDPRDPRILRKQCVSLARAGYSVTLIACATEDAEFDDVYLKAVKIPASRWERILSTGWRIYREARAIDAQVYHFHDPELIPWGLLLHYTGKQVIYDIHEDYFTSIRQKSYLPRRVRELAAYCMRRVERFAARRLTCVIAESYYSEIFPKAVQVLNYPLIDSQGSISVKCDPFSRRLLYTGNVTPDRGAYNHVKLLAVHRDIEIHMIGRCSSSFAQELRKVAGLHSERLHLEGVGEYVDPSRISAVYASGGWLAGLALFPDTEHYRRKVLTKIFEYMMAGLPVLCSNFPAWRELVEGLECGLVIDPAEPEQSKCAIRFLNENPEAARAMGDRGRHAVTTAFNWSSESRKLEHVYQRLISRKR